MSETYTNCGPGLIDYIIHGNDDAIRAIKLFVGAFAEACLEGEAAAADKGSEEEAMEKGAEEAAQ